MKIVLRRRFSSVQILQFYLIRNHLSKRSSAPEIITKIQVLLLENRLTERDVVETLGIPLSSMLGKINVDINQKVFRIYSTLNTL